jgi:hypothetical protein
MLNSAIYFHALDVNEAGCSVALDRKSPAFIVGQLKAQARPGRELLACCSERDPRSDHAEVERLLRGSMR